MTDAAVQILLDKQDIAETIFRYCRGMDRIDNDLARSAFHPEAKVQYGADIYSGPATGFVEMVAKTHEGMTISHHQVGNCLIEVDGDSAKSETYITVTLHRQEPDGSLVQVRGIGRYLDQWARRDRKWKIVDRVYVHSIDETHPVSANAFVVTGARDLTDISYRYVGGA